MQGRPLGPLWVCVGLVHVEYELQKLVYKPRGVRESHRAQRQNPPQRDAK